MKRIKLSAFLAIFFISSLSLNGQSSELPMGNDAYHILDRLEIKAGKENESPFFSTFKPYKRKEVTQFAIQMDNMSNDSVSLNAKDLIYIFKDNNDWINQTVEAPEGQVYSDKKFYKKSM